MIKAALESSIAFLETLIQIFAVIVAIGIVGEVGFGVRHWILNRRLQAIQHAEDLNQEQTIAGLQRDTGEAKRRAEELKAANLQLERTIAPRRLTPKQVRELESLTEFAGRTIDIRSYANDAEGFVLGSQLVDALSKAHIGIADNRFTMQAGTEVLLGLSIEGGDKALVAKLHAILAENKLDERTTISRGTFGVSISTSIGKIGRGPTVAEITVGLKPIK